MGRASTLLLLVVVAAFAGACGDSGERTYGAGSPSEVRVGGFDASQVNRFNRVVADYNGAAVAWQERTPTCQAETKRLLAKDAHPARLVECHRDATVQVVRAVAELRRVFTTFGGQWSPECGPAVRSMGTFLVRFHTAWRRVLADWNALARQRPADLNAHVDSARTMAAGFGKLQLADVHEACMTERDVTEGLELAADAADAVTE